MATILIKTKCSNGKSIVGCCRFDRITRIFMFVFVVGILIWNIFYTCIEYPRNSDVGFDYLGVIVSAVSVIIALLIGWQIFSFIAYKKEVETRVNDIAKKSDDLVAVKNNIDSLRERMGLVVSDMDDISNLNTAEAYLLSSLSLLAANENDSAIKAFFRGVLVFKGIQNKEKGLYKDKMETARGLTKILPKDVKLDDIWLQRFKTIAIDSGEASIIDYINGLELQSKAQ